MKQNWVYKKLGTFLHTTSGGTPLKSVKDYYEGGNIPWLRSGEVCQKDIYKPEIYITSKAVNESNAKLVPENSLVIAMYGATAGQVGIIRRTMTTNQAVCSIFPSQYYLQDFLYYYFSFKKDKIVDKAYGAAQPNISQTIIKNLYIPVPPMETQERIVKELDEINGMIEGRKEQIKLLDQLAQSIFYEMFGDPISNPKGWEVKSLKDLTLEKLSYGSGASGIPFDGLIRYIRITDIDEKGLLKEEIASSPSEYDRKYDLNSGDLLLARSGATVGKSFLYNEIIGKAIYAGYLIRVRPNPEIILPLFIYQFTKTQYYWDYIKNSIRGAAQPNVNAQLYSALKVFIPPIQLQNEFAAKVELIEEQKKDIDNSIKELETLLASRMDYWFN